MNCNEEVSDTISIKQKGLENLILLLIGASDREISLIHLQKESFILWNFHPYMKEFLHFIKHLRGPFSSEVEKIVLYPYYLDGCWDYRPPSKNDKLTGGFIKITSKGVKKYISLFNNAKQNENLCILLTGIKAVRELYDRLSPEELLLLIYDTYPEYKQKSNVSNSIFKKKEKLATNIYEKGLIDEDRFNTLVNGKLHNIPA